MIYKNLQSLKYHACFELNQLKIFGNILLITGRGSGRK